MKLQGLKQITMRYAPLLPGASSVIEFYNQCTCPTSLKSNPDCFINLQLLDRGDPTLEVEFPNGEKLFTVTKGKTMRDLEFIVEEKRQDIRTLQMLREEGYMLERLKPEDIPDLEKAKAMAKPEAKKLYTGLKPVPPFRLS